MLRNGTWHSYDSDCQWLSFDALRFVHRVQPVTSGFRYAITLYTPGKLERLTAQDWDILAKTGFPIYLFEPFGQPKNPGYGGTRDALLLRELLVDNSSI